MLGEVGVYIYLGSIEGWSLTTSETEWANGTELVNHCYILATIKWELQGLSFKGILNRKVKFSFHIKSCEADYYLRAWYRKMRKLLKLLHSSYL